jgi:hypothetical protein
MPRVSLGVLVVLVLAACRSDAIAPPSKAASREGPAAAYVAPTVSLAVVKTTNAKTAGLDDILGRVVPTLGVSGLVGPLTVLRDSVPVVSATARAALLTASYGALDRFASKASPSQLSEVSTIRLVLDAVGVDYATR